MLHVAFNDAYYKATIAMQSSREIDSLFGMDCLTQAEKVWLNKIPWFFPDLRNFSQIPWLFPDWKNWKCFSRFSLISRLAGNPGT